MTTFKGLREIPLTSILEPEALPRRYLDKEKLLTLAGSISENGVIQPVLVTRGRGGYRLVAGLRRLLAAKQAGLARIPAIIISASDGELALSALLDNMYRQELSCIEQALAIEALITCGGLTQKQAAERLMLSESAISNKLKVLQLDNEQREFAAENRLTERHLRAIMRLPRDRWDSALWLCAGSGLSVAACEREVDSELRLNKQRRVKVAVKDVRLFFNTIERAVDLMRCSGIEASATRLDRQDYIEYTIKIPVAGKKPDSR